MMESLGQDLVEVVSHLEKENKRYHDALEEVREVISKVPYREYTTNKIRHRLLRTVEGALEGYE